MIPERPVKNILLNTFSRVRVIRVLRSCKEIRYLQGYPDSQMHKAEKYDFFLPYLALLVWIWSGAAVMLTGWPWLWGILPLGPAEGFWAPFAALVCTVVAFGLGARVLDRLEEQGAAFYRFFTRPDRVNSRLLFFFLLYLAIFFLCWNLRSENHFMGDGWVLSLEVEKPFVLWDTAPLTFFILQSFNRLLQFAGLTGGEATYAVLHCLLFPIFLWFCWRIAGLVAERIPDRLVLFLLIAAGSSLQLFSGYVENYTLLHFWLALYLYSGLRYIAAGSESRVPWRPSLAFVLASASHLTGVVLFPSLLFLWLLRVPWLKRIPGIGRFIIKSGPSLAVAAACSIMLVLGPIFSDRSSMVPLLGGRQENPAPYLFFSLTHLWEKFNFLLLICPAALVALPLAVTRWRIFRSMDSLSFSFAAWSAAGCVFFSTVFNPLLGIRDWDLISLPAIPLALLAGWTLSLAMPAGARRKALLRALALACALHAGTFVWINSDINRGVRFLDRIRQADFHRQTGKMNLGALLYERQFFQQAINQYRLFNSPERFEMQRAALNIGLCFLSLEMPDSLIGSLRELGGSYMEPAAARKYYILLSLAYDMKCRSDSATIPYLSLQRTGLQLEDSERIKWAGQMEGLAGCYNQRLAEKEGDVEAMLFFLRYYTLKQDSRKIKQLYDIILSHTYTVPEWNCLHEFACLCGHRDYLDKMVEQAERQRTGSVKRE